MRSASALSTSRLSSKYWYSVARPMPARAQTSAMDAPW
jgi:hypothetical protein